MKTQIPFDKKILPIFEKSPSRSDLLADLRAAAKVIANGNSDLLVSADDVRKLVIVPKDRLNTCGGIFRQDCWEQVSYVQSKRPCANGRRVGVYRYHASRDKLSPCYTGDK